MSDTLNTVTSWQLASGEVPKTQVTDEIAIAGSKRVSKRLTITSGAEVTISLADVPTPGRCYIRNMDATNFVKVGPATGVYLCAPKPGECESFRILSTLTNLYARADTADVEIVIDVFPN